MLFKLLDLVVVTMVSRYLTTILAFAVILLSVFGVFEQRTLGFQRAMDADVPVVRTATPKQTVESLSALANALEEKLTSYARDKDAETYSSILHTVDELVSLIDLSDIPRAYVREYGVHTVVALLGIREAFPTFELESLPDQPGARVSDNDEYLLDGTPLALVRIQEGPREGEYLFKDSTIDVAPRFLRELRFNTVQNDERDWQSVLNGFTGPWFPPNFSRLLPASLLEVVMGTPVWKILLTLVSGSIVFLLVQKIQSKVQLLRSKDMVATATVGLVKTLIAVTGLLVFGYFLHFQLHISGAFAATLYLLFETVWTIALAALFWFGSISAIDALVGKKTVSIDGSLVQLLSRVFAFFGVVWIIACGAQTLGFPLLSILAGLGIGGIAAALAIRPTLENLIGGLILYLDKPIRVGDFCQFGVHMGTVERIGVRSTQVRALDRTLINVPNSSFSNMELINWAQCDQMMIDVVVDCATRLRQINCAMCWQAFARWPTPTRASTIIASEYVFPILGSPQWIWPYGFMQKLGNGMTTSLFVRTSSCVSNKSSRIPVLHSLSHRRRFTCQKTRGSTPRKAKPRLTP
nr:mechanosensitive ion channel family protein [Ruegeria profundi]